MSETEVSRQQRFMSDQSDTESIGGQAQSGSSRPAPRRFNRQVHSEAEASDYEAPPAPRPGRSVRQSALDAINRGVVPRRPRPGRSLILIQPGHHDKNFNHIRRMFKTPRRRTRGLTCVPSIGHYRDSLLSTSRQSFTESETETDDNKLNETSAIDFKQYDIIARLWMEQVDAKMVEKSDTMFLSVLPADRDLPRELTSSYRAPMEGTGDSALPPQWVIARGRTLLSRRQRRLEDGDKSNDELMDMSRASSPGRQLILFFKVSGNWMDVAWVLFDGLQTDPETVRMIRDIQLKNPAGLAEQVHDLMHRWWRRKGHGATVSELQRALDFCHIPYIHEEYHDPRATIVSYTDTEDDLDIGQISDTDPDVTRLTHVYNVRSLNASFNVDNPPPLPSSSPPPLEPADSSDKERPVRDHSPSSAVDVVLRNLQHAAARSHRRKLDSSVDSTDTLDDKKRSLAIVHPQPQTNSDVSDAR